MAVIISLGIVFYQKMGKLGLGDARQILSMLNGGEVASSKLSHRMVALLQEEGLLFSKTNGSRCKYRIDGALQEACRIFLVQQFGLKCSLEEWVENNSSLHTMASRAEAVDVMGDSKYQQIRTFRGFLVNSYSPIEASLYRQPFLVHPNNGSMIFVSTPEQFNIPSDVLIVGMENAENFMHIRKQKWLFDTLYPNKKIIFVSRYPQNALSDLREWLLRIPNHYIHFGDFDLAGIHIYLSEFYAYLGERSSFLIPNDIEERLKTGNARLYDQQYEKFKDMKVSDPHVQSLVDMIHYYCRGYEQEGYIEEL